VAGPRVGREPRRLADFRGDGGRDPAEIAREKARERMALRVLRHLEQHPELDAIGMRLDLARRRRELLVGPWILFRLAFGGDVRALDVPIRRDRPLELLVDVRAALPVVA